MQLYAHKSLLMRKAWREISVGCELKPCSSETEDMTLAIDLGLHGSWQKNLFAAFWLSEYNRNVANEIFCQLQWSPRSITNVIYVTHGNMTLNETEDIPLQEEKYMKGTKDEAKVRTFTVFWRLTKLAFMVDFEPWTFGHTQYMQP